MSTAADRGAVPDADHGAGPARWPVLALTGAIRAYQLVVSPLTGPSCRYYPSCSSYALLAVRRHGALRGGWLALRRLARCHPWTPGGVDDVPPVRGPLTSAPGHGHVHRARGSAR